MGKLGAAQNRQVQDYVLKEWEDIEEIRPSYGRVAKTATEALRFAVNPGNIRGAVIALGRTWPNGVAKEPKDAKERELLLAMADFVEGTLLIYRRPPSTQSDKELERRIDRFDKALADVQ